MSSWQESALFQLKLLEVSVHNYVFAWNWPFLSKKCSKHWCAVLCEICAKEYGQLLICLKSTYFFKNVKKASIWQEMFELKLVEKTRATVNFSKFLGFSKKWLLTVNLVPTGLFFKKVYKISIWEGLGLFELRLGQNSARNCKFA